MGVAGDTGVIVIFVVSAWADGIQRDSFLAAGIVADAVQVVVVVVVLSGLGSFDSFLAAGMVANTVAVVVVVLAVDSFLAACVVADFVAVVVVVLVVSDLGSSCEGDSAHQHQQGEQQSEDLLHGLFLPFKEKQRFFAGRRAPSQTG